ncbi:MAG: Replication-associated recombination protein RarA [uncultured Chloroflexi bacterium]|uniref:Replication-associated recombination protein RarA n=1 Tax=uncultured Chloroflexota bacterium TaxID=166587 RepID=A0A6J4J465_9CHLR|nr:MAG: Replication-associated recombination protein RarA [uncultured Chloroflexota bacterium]
MAEQLSLLPDPTPDAPLAVKMRPRALDEFAGQQHILGPGKPLRRAIEEDRLGSIILWGPPGSGKTTLALLIARTTRAHFASLSAVTDGVADLRKVIEEAKKRRRAGQRTVLLVDEVHRWSKSQQDALLPYVEDGTIILVGATTENPYFDVIAALRSRLRIFKLEPLSGDDLAALVQRALDDPERGLGDHGLSLTPEALQHIVAISGGDARVALNALEAAAAGAEDIITPELVEAATQRRAVRYDKLGDDHYQTASAFIKSLRGSDPDAAVFYLAKMLAAGEDPRFIARRLVILASEDVGNADHQALVVASAAYTTVERIGMPEAGLTLSQATIYLAVAPKSNRSADALWRAQAAIEAGANTEVPLHLRNASFGGARGLGYGQGYRYAHDYDGAYAVQRHLPDGVEGPFYEPSDRGYEQRIAERMDRWRKAREAGD